MLKRIMLNIREKREQIPQTPLYYEFRSINQRSFHGLIKHYVVAISNKIGVFLASLVVLPLPIAMIVMGSMYRWDCPQQHYIPVYLIMSGVVSFLMLSWILFSEVDNRFNHQLNYYVRIHLAQWFLMAILFIWCILGTFAVFSIITPVYKGCDLYLYYFAMGVVIAQLLLFFHLCTMNLFFGCSCCCALPGRQASPRFNTGNVESRETEV